MKKIVVLGAGYAGIAAAKRLQKKLKKNEASITVIDRHPYHTLMTELHEFAGGRVDEGAVKISLDRIFAGSRVNVIIDTVRTVDFDKKIIHSQKKEYTYDYLLVGTGGDPECFGIPGIEEHGYTLWSYSDASKIHCRVQECFAEAACEIDEDKRRKLLHFVVAGAGFTGMEMAGELVEWKHQLAEMHRVNEDEVTITVVEAMDKILPILPEKLQNKSQKYLSKKGCQFRLSSPITGLVPGVISLKDGSTIESDTLIWTCGVHGGEFASNLPLTKGRCGNRACPKAKEWGTCDSKTCTFAGPGDYINGKRGRLKVNETLQSSDYDNVYVIGDIVWHIHEGKPVPQIVETAVQSGETAANNILAELRGKEKENFEPQYHGFMVSLGGRYGVAHLMGWLSLTGIFAMGVKHFINLVHFWSVAGFNQLWAYIKHEFLDIKGNRSFIHGLLSSKVQGHWVAILRVFTGAMWLTEGIKKVLEGWLDPNNIMIIADATSAASEEVAGAATEWAPFLFQEPTGLYNWMIDAFISKAPFLFQAGLVLGEIALGLALIGGLFTVLAGLASIALSVMFTISAMATKEIMWYFFSGFVFLGGAGRGTGLDHWVMPWLKKLWNRIPFVQKHHLYLGEPVVPKGKK